MTMSNNDMAALFPDVIQCMTIPALEIKKMYVLCYHWMDGLRESDGHGVTELEMRGQS